MNYAQVIVLGRALKHPLTYDVSRFPDLKPWCRVLVPLGKKEVLGMVLDIEENLPENIPKNIKPISHQLDDYPFLVPPIWELCQFASQYYGTRLEDMLALALPKSQTKKPKNPTKSPKIGLKPQKTLSKEQEESISFILKKPKNTSFLIQGVTGSGKTQIYLELAKLALEQGEGVLVLVPEIALTPQLQSRFEESLGEPCVLLHSQTTQAQKRLGFERLIKGERRVVVGARSAIFAPFQKLGLIVVDEEHDTSFKQEEHPSYNARDLALFRGKNEQARVILGSATPSLESYYNTQISKIHLVHLKSRIHGQSLPAIEVIDLKEKNKSVYETKSKSEGQNLIILSNALKGAIQDTLDQHKQAILFLNRRGYASFVLCEACGETLHCPACSLALTYHQKAYVLKCHTCNYQSKLFSHCPTCKEGPLKALGLGTERVSEEVALHFPHARVARWDRDHIQKQRDLLDILDKIHKREIDILIGTQSLSKGHDFPFVDLVGIICADIGLSVPDFRASERTFQLLTQVSGRAGRVSGQGKVLLQCYNAKHPAMVFAKEHNVEGFLKEELEIRKNHFLPPFSKELRIWVKSMHAQKAKEVALELKTKLFSLLQNERETRLLGPAEAPIFKLKNDYRYVIEMRFLKHGPRLRVLHWLQNQQEALKRSKVRLFWDVDPMGY